MYSSLMVHKKESKRDRKKKEFAAEGKPNDIIGGPHSLWNSRKRACLFFSKGTRALFKCCRVEKQATLKRFILGEQGNNLQVDIGPNRSWNSEISWYFTYIEVLNLLRGSGSVFKPHEFILA